MTQNEARLKIQRLLNIKERSIYQCARSVNCTNDYISAYNEIKKRYDTILQLQDILCDKEPKFISKFFKCKNPNIVAFQYIIRLMSRNMERVVQKSYYLRALELIKFINERENEK